MLCFSHSGGVGGSSCKIISKISSKSISTSGISTSNSNRNLFSSNRKDSDA
jgi:hypothetical protein